MELRELARILRRLGRLYRWPILRPLYLAVWRAREREVGNETTGPATTSSPDYAYGKVSGLYPDLVVMTETTEDPFVCCGYCSAGMVVRSVRPQLANKMSAVAHPIRADGGRPHNNGSKASELRAGAREAFDVELEPLARGEIPDRLRKGYAVVVNLDYAELPSWFRVQGGSFGHSIALFGWRDDGDKAGALDPLWSNGARGAWIPWEQLKPALWSDGEHSGTVVRLEEPEPDEPPPAPEPEPEAGWDAGPSIRDAEARGRTETLDATFRSWIAPGARSLWEAASWDRAEWSLVPWPLEALERSRTPATFGDALWTGSLWSEPLEGC